MKRLSILIGMTIAVSLYMSSAQAGVIDFRTGPNSQGPDLFFTGGVVTATTGGAPGPDGNTANVVKRGTGLGVNNANINDTQAIQQNEFLIITFDSPTILNEVIFAQIDDAGNRDSFALFIDGVAIDLDAILGGDIFTDVGDCVASDCTIDFSALGIGTVFAFTDGSSVGIDGGGRRDNYSLGQITFTTVVVISEPAPLLLFFSALWALISLRRRRKTQI